MQTEKNSNKSAAREAGQRPVWEIFANPLPIGVCLNAAWIAQNGDSESAGAYIRQAVQLQQEVA